MQTGVLASLVYYLMQCTASLLGFVTSSLLGRAETATAVSQVETQVGADPNTAAA